MGLAGWVVVGDFERWLGALESKLGFVWGLGATRQEKKWVRLTFFFERND